MTDITDPVLEAYAEAHTTAPGEHLLALAEETRATLMAPQMMVGALEGRFLEMLVYALRPAWVLEIGTFSGYSSLSMAAGLPPGGRITTCVELHITLVIDPGQIQIRRLRLPVAAVAAARRRNRAAPVQR